MKSRNLCLKIYKKVDEILTEPFFEKLQKVDDRPTDIQDLRIYATSRRIKRNTGLLKLQNLSVFEPHLKKRDFYDTKSVTILEF